MSRKSSRMKFSDLQVFNQNLEKRKGNFEPSVST